MHIAQTHRYLCTVIHAKGSLFLSLSNQTSHTLTHTHKSDVTARITAVLHAHRLTDDGMHLVLQTGSTAYM